MPYFHVLVANRSNLENYRCLLSDLSEHGLRSRFLRAYHKGRDLLIDGRLHRVEDFGAVQIRMTERPAAAELEIIKRKSREEIDRINRSSAVFFISAGHGHSRDDLTYAGEDATARFLRRPPGRGRHEWLANPWLVTILGGLVLALLTAILL